MQVSLLTHFPVLQKLLEDRFEKEIFMFLTSFINVNDYELKLKTLRTCKKLIQNLSPDKLIFLVTLAGNSLNTYHEALIIEALDICYQVILLRHNEVFNKQ
jgi:hypothetical protein